MRAGDALEAGTALHRRYEAIQAAPRGRHAAAPPAADPLPEASALVDRLPGFGVDTACEMVPEAGTR